MNGPEHYAEAEHLLAKAGDIKNQPGTTMAQFSAHAQTLIAAATAHAKLAEIALAYASLPGDITLMGEMEWRGVINRS